VIKRFGKIGEAIFGKVNPSTHRMKALLRRDAVGEVLSTDAFFWPPSAEDEKTLQRRNENWKNGDLRNKKTT